MLSGVGGLVTLAPSEVVPEGASPRTYDGDYNVGEWHTRAGLTNLYPSSTTSIGPNLPTSQTATNWAAPGNILSAGASFASHTPLNKAADNAITPAGYAFNVPLTTQVVGLLLTLTGYSNVPGTSINCQLVSNGAVIGTVMQGTMPTTAGPIVFGDLLNQWGTFLTPAIVNSVGFGVLITVFNDSFPAGTAFLSNATITLGLEHREC